MSFERQQIATEMILTSLNLLAADPNLAGSASRNLFRVRQFLSTITELFRGGEEALDDLEAFADKISAMVAQKRGPNREELDDLILRHEEVKDRLETARQILTGELQEEEETEDEEDEE